MGLPERTSFLDRVKSQLLKEDGNLLALRCGQLFDRSALASAVFDRGSEGYVLPCATDDVRLRGAATHPTALRT